MLRSLKDLQDRTIRTGDQELGEITDFLFDHFEWAVRYAIISNEERELIVSIHTLEIPSTEGEPVIVRTEFGRLVNGAIYVSGKGLSREEEEALSDYFDWPRYWVRDVPNTFPGDLTSIPLIDMETNKEPVIPTTGSEQENLSSQESHLASVNDIMGYRIEARDGGTGKLVDLIVDDENWNLDFLVVDSGKLLPGKKVLISPQWVQVIDRQRSEIRVDLNKETVRNSPEFTSSAGITPDYWTNVKDYYGHDQD